MELCEERVQRVIMEEILKIRQASQVLELLRFILKLIFRLTASLRYAFL